MKSVARFKAVAFPNLHSESKLAACDPSLNGLEQLQIICR
jgi:hypothetical protein